MVKNSVHIKNIGELLSLPYLANDIRTRINSLVLDCNLVERQLSAPVFLNAATIILVLSGTAQLNINYRSYFIQANTAVFVLAVNLIQELARTNFHVGRDYADNGHFHLQYLQANFFNTAIKSISLNLGCSEIKKYLRDIITKVKIIFYLAKP